jgi:hypothetical protein
MLGSRPPVGAADGCVFAAADGGAATPAAPRGGGIDMGIMPPARAVGALGPDAFGSHALVASEPDVAGVPAIGDANEPALVAPEGADAERAGCSSVQAMQIVSIR